MSTATLSLASIDRLDKYARYLSGYLWCFTFRKEILSDAVLEILQTIPDPEKFITEATREQIITIIRRVMWRIKYRTQRDRKATGYLSNLTRDQKEEIIEQPKPTQPGRILRKYYSRIKDVLTEREAEVFERLAFHPDTVKDVAKRYNLKPTTVRYHKCKVVKIIRQNIAQGRSR